MADGSYFGGNYVPGVTAGGTPGLVPPGQDSIVTQPGEAGNFQGYVPPFVRVKDHGNFLFGGSSRWVDAAGATVPDQVANAWAAAEAEKGRKAPEVTAGADGTVSSEDMGLALNQYR